MVSCPAFGRRVGGIIAVVPLATFGESGAVVFPRGFALEHFQRDEPHRACADLAQLVGDRVHAGCAAVVVVWPQQHIAAFERCQVCFMPRVRTVRPAGGHVARHQISRCVSGLFSLAQDHRRIGTERQFIQAQKRSGLGQSLPAPLGRFAVAAFAPGQRRKDLLRFAVLIGAEVETVQRHERLALVIAINPDLGRCAVLPVFDRAFVHCLGRDRLDSYPLGRFAFGRCGFGGRGISSYAEQIRQFVAGLDVSAAVDVAHQVNQVAALVASREVRPGAFADTDFQRARTLVRSGGVGCGVLFTAVYLLPVGQPVSQYLVDVA
ncbi:hypothetical protein APX70_08566 [Pseudomonas syringae pv. maculicola]|uniref:Uncharacterized protein n=1 Tax=Pseudomonas syringae pv. maculicola TaxID=59511 RepID=A0A3M2VE23_PSEYM|nr:hypothetical protein APX70_08566 [Pseudomonas syringae pv. maculicola]